MALRQNCLAALSLGWREVIRFKRQRSRVVGALLQPLVFWVLFGAGLAGSFRSPRWSVAEMSYQEFFLPGAAVLVILFTSIFSSISIIEDRNEGFLQGVLASPVRPWSIVLGKVLGGAVLGTVQTGVFLLVGLISLWSSGSSFGISETSLLSIFGLMCFIGLVGFGLSALGFSIAWVFDSVQGFHAVMSVVLMPMWLLSGAFFPGSESRWLRVLMIINPLTYGVSGVRRLMCGSCTFLDGGVGDGLPSMGKSLGITVLFAVVAFGLAVAAVRWPVNRNGTKWMRRKS